MKSDQVFHRSGLMKISVQVENKTLVLKAIPKMFKSKISHLKTAT